MALPNNLAQRLKKRTAALEQKKKLLSNSCHGKGASKPMAVAAVHEGPPPGAATQPTVTVVRMQGDSILSLTVSEASGPQHLSPALRECVDRYLESAQCGRREVILLWPGSLECLPLIHAIATIEYWAQGYKQGLRSILYPATSASFFRMNHIFVDRDDVHAMTNELREVSFNGVNPAVKQGCVQKDLMLFALASMKVDAKAAGLQPCLNELLPHFYLERGDSTEIEILNYGDTYLSHILSKLSKPGHSQSLRESTLPQLGEPATAPDAVFALSYKMTKTQIEQSLRTLKALGTVNVILVDCTRSAFERVEKLQHRIAVFVRAVIDVFGENDPGIQIVTNDPRQMTQLRAALNNKAQARSFDFGRTKAVCHPVSSLGLEPASGTLSASLSPANIAVEITDRESARLLVNAFRIRREKGIPAALVEALTASSKFIQTMANLPSAAVVLHKWLDDSMADDAQRRRFDWVAQRNRLKGTLDTLDVNLRGRVLKWIEQTNAVLDAQQEGTPLARAMLARIRTRTGEQDKVLVVTQNRFYADLAQEYFLRDSDSELLRDRVQFTAIKMLEEKLASGGVTRVIVCALSPDLLRWAVTTPSLPCPVDFLLTQQTAMGARYSLEPVLGFPDVFKAYFPRVHALYDPIIQAQGTSSAVMPEFDYQTPTFSLTTTGSVGSGYEQGPSDYVEITLEDGRKIQRGLHARVYVYDPAARESRAQGFRPDSADHLKCGDLLFVKSEEMREQVEAAFAAAGVTFDEASKYETLLRKYHSQVLQRVRERFAGSVADAARAIQEAMQGANCAQEVGNARYWINLKDAESTPYGELMPQAPRHFDTFRVFMEVLGFDRTAIQVFWDGAVKRVRGTRISDGLSLGEHYDRVLFDPEAASAYDRLTPGVLNTLRARALDSVYEVADVTFGTTTPRS